MKRRLLILTGVAALLLGVVGGWLVWNHYAPQRALQRIAADDVETRRAGWVWLRGEEDGEHRAQRLLDEINDRLMKADGQPLLEAAGELRTLGLWGFEHQPKALACREILLRAQSVERSDQLIAVESLGQVIDVMEPDGLQRVVVELLRSRFEDIRASVLSLELGRLGRARAHELRTLDDQSLDVDVRRTIWLAQAWATHDSSEPVVVDFETNPPIVEAQLFAAAERGEFDLQLTEAITERQAELALHMALPLILARADYLYARNLLERMAEDDRGAAARVWQMARMQRRMPRLMRQAAENEAETLFNRQQAAWLATGLSSSVVQNMLRGEVSVIDDRVFGAVLLAERYLDRPTALVRAESWIRSFDDHKKKAGAMLSALLDANQQLLVEAYEAEDVPEVRTIQRLALAALNVELDDAMVSSELAQRSLELDTAVTGFNPDVVLCRLAAGDRDVLSLLTSDVGGYLYAEASVRMWLIDRFVPEWSAEIGQPLGTDSLSYRLHFDALDVLRQLTEPQLKFDPQRKLFATPASQPSE